MRLHGTYTFPAVAERVYGALFDASMLASVIPGCERLIQLGPPDVDGIVTFEARIQKGALTFSLVPVRRPGHFRLGLHGRVGSGTLTANGVIDLVGQEEHTLGAYALEMDIPGAQPAAAQGVAQAICERFAAELWHAAPETLPAGEVLPTLAVMHEVKTPRGRIIALPQLARLGTPADFARGAWIERALWMSAGLVLGVGAAALALAVVPRMGERDG
jgi:carbon monoxide dehydrogenase subunit G